MAKLIGKDIMKISFIFLLSFASCYAPMDTEFLKAQATLDSLKNIPSSSPEKSQQIKALMSVITIICDKRAIDINRLKSDPTYKVDRNLNPEEMVVFTSAMQAFQANFDSIDNLLKQAEDLNFKSKAFQKNNNNTWSGWAYGYYSYYKDNYYCTLV